MVEDWADPPETKKLMCPICGRRASTYQPSSGRDSVQFECERCYRFELTRTALAVAEAKKLSSSALAPVASYRLRQIQITESEPVITSDRLDELFQDGELPRPDVQAENLVQWLAEVGRNSPADKVVVDSQEALAGRVGAADVGGLRWLINGLEEEGILSQESSRGELRLGLTFKEWRRTGGNQEDPVVPRAMPRRPGSGEDAASVAETNAGQLTIEYPDGMSAAAVATVQQLVSRLEELNPGTRFEITGVSRRDKPHRLFLQLAGKAETDEDARDQIERMAAELRAAQSIARTEREAREKIENAYRRLRERLNKGENVPTIRVCASFDISGWSRQSEEKRGRDSQLLEAATNSICGDLVEVPLTKTAGDGVLLLFPTRNSALSASCAIRDVMSRFGVEMRIGVSFGTVVIKDDESDFLGDVVNEAVRLQESGEIGKVLATAEVCRSEDIAAGEFEFRERTVTLKKGFGDRQLGDRWSVLEVHYCGNLPTIH